MATPAATPVGVSTGTPVTQAIGPAGGMVTSADGRMAVVVPPGALNADVAIAVDVISNESPGAVGPAYRLGPDGQTFALPVTLTFQYTDEDVAGTATEQFRIGYQDAEKQWRPSPTTVDVGAKRISTTTSHFSDWGVTTGARIRPASASVKVKSSVALTAVSCPIIEIAADGHSVLAGCSSDRLTLSNWSVNGVAGGSAAIGTVSGQGARGTYGAPMKPPSPPKVQVSAELTRTDGGKTLLFANILVLDDGMGPQMWGGTTTFIPRAPDRPDEVTWKAGADFMFWVNDPLEQFLHGLVTVTRVPPPPAGPNDCTTTVEPATQVITISPENTLGAVVFYSDPVLSTYFGTGSTGFSVTKTIVCPNQPARTSVSGEMVTWLVIPMTMWDGSGGVDGTTTDPSDGGTWTWNLHQLSGTN